MPRVSQYKSAFDGFKDAMKVYIGWHQKIIKLDPSTANQHLDAFSKQLGVDLSQRTITKDGITSVVGSLLNTQ